MKPPTQKQPAARKSGGAKRKPTFRLEDLRAVTWSCAHCHERVPLILSQTPKGAIAAHVLSSRASVTSPPRERTDRLAAALQAAQQLPPVFLFTRVPDACPSCGAPTDTTRVQRRRHDEFVDAFEALLKSPMALSFEFSDRPTHKGAGQ